MSLTMVEVAEEGPVVKRQRLNVPAPTSENVRDLKAQKPPRTSSIFAPYRVRRLKLLNQHVELAM